MKRYILCLLLAILAMPAFQASGRLLDDLADVQNVERVFVGPATLEHINVAEVTGLDKDKVKNIRSLEIFTTSRRSAAKELKDAFQKFVKDKGYVIQLEHQDSGGEATKVYARSEKGKPTSKVSAVIITTETKSTFVIVALDADIDLDKLIY